MRILEEFWYGNIEPTEYDTSSCKEYKKLMELICRNEEKLQATMTDEQKELFSKYADCVREYQTITDCLIFQNGFKLGARIMLEVMEEQLNTKQMVMVVVQTLKKETFGIENILVKLYYIFKEVLR